MNDLHSPQSVPPSLGGGTGEAPIAVVILNWNGEQMLATYLRSVVQYSSDEAVVYVADNASTDHSVEMLRRDFPEVRLVLLEKNYGFAEGYNRALAQIEAEYYVLLNSDVEVTEHWLTPLIQWMDSHPDTAACQPKLLAMHDRGAFEYSGAAGGYLDRYGYPFCRGRAFQTIERDEGQYDQPAEVLWVTGACMMIRSEDYKKTGGLDARFFAHCEEIDLCWRLRIAGRRLYCVPESRVYHVGGGTLPKVNPQKTFLNFRNNLTMLYKNLPQSDLRHVMRWRWWFDYLAAYKMLLIDRNWGDFRAVYRARKAFKRWRHDFKDDRHRIQAAAASVATTDSQVPADPRTPFSLLWQYYVRGRKTYNQFIIH